MCILGYGGRMLYMKFQEKPLKGRGDTAEMDCVLHVKCPSLWNDSDQTYKL